MKKRLEADLVSIAERILKSKNNSEVNFLHIEIKKLYDAITILKFYNDNFEQLKETVSEDDFSVKLSQFMDESTVDVDSKTEVAPSENVKSTKKEAAFEPIFDLVEPAISKSKKDTAKEVSFDNLLDDTYFGANFVKPQDLEQEKKQLIFEKIASGLNISSSDRIDFEQQLFANSSEDFNRVISQLSTFDNFAEAKDFIDQIVKPDYNNWADNADIANRFIDIIENKFV